MLFLILPSIILWVVLCIAAVTFAIVVDSNTSKKDNLQKEEIAEARKKYTKAVEAFVYENKNDFVFEKENIPAYKPVYFDYGRGDKTRGHYYYNGLGEVCWAYYLDTAKCQYPLNPKEEVAKALRDLGIGYSRMSKCWNWENSSVEYKCSTDIGQLRFTVLD